MRAQSRLGGGQERIDQQHARGKLTARERLDLLLDPGLVRRVRRVRRPIARRTSAWTSSASWATASSPATARSTAGWCSCSARTSRSSAARCPRRTPRRSARSWTWPCSVGAPIIGLNDSGGARIQEGVVSLGGYADIFLRNTLASGVVPQISLDHGPLRRGRGLLAGHHRRHDHGRGHELHVRDRAGGRAGRDPRGRRSRAPRRRERSTPRSAASRISRRPTRLPRSTSRAGSWRTCRRTTCPSRRVVAASDPVDRRDAALDSDRARRADASPTTCTRSSTASSTTATFLELQPAWAANIIIGFARLGGHERRRRGAAARGARRRAGHRRLGQGRPLRAHVRCLQRAAADPRGRARLPARRDPGARRHHPPRRQAAVRLLRGDRAQGHGHHPQGVRRRVRRHELQARPRRRQPRVAHGAHRGHGRRGCGQASSSATSWPQADDQAAELQRADARVRGHVRQPVRRGGPGLRRRRHRAVGDPAPGHRRVPDAARASGDRNPSRKHGNIPL